MTAIEQCAMCGEDYDIEQPHHCATNDAGEITSNSIEDTLLDRGSRYGKFSSHSMVSRQLRTTMFQAMMANENIARTTPAMEEAIILICHKLARIANGDPAYDDSWRDIAGYAQLVVDHLNHNEKG